MLKLLENHVKIFEKILPNSKIWKKKKFLELCLNMIIIKQF